MHAKWMCASLLCVALPAARAASTDAAGEPAFAGSGNVALTTDYVFRGLTQTWGRPAVQGGADLDAGGFHAGFWGSSISGRSYPGGVLELDLYADYGRSPAPGWSWRVGLYGYVYPGANLDRARPALPSRSPNTLEANAALSWKWLTLKYSRALTNYFGVDVEQGYDGDSKGTGYLQLDAVVPLDDAWSLALHAGRTHYTTWLVAPLASGATDPSYTDLGATLKYRFAAHWSASLGITHAGNGAFYRRTASFLDFVDVRDVGGTRGFLMLQGTF